jgi:hypothetical protein
MVGDSEKEKEIMRRAIEERDVKFLCKWHFDEEISTLQEVLIRKIAFQEHKRISICAMTRWGKSFCVSRAVALYLLMNSNKKITLLAPTIEQSMILRDYMAELVLKCRALREIAHLEVKGEERLKQQASRSRQTFDGNREYRVFTAHGEAEGLMGHGLGSGGGILILDEACLIDENARGKIGRMLGDNPGESMIIELFNPWTRSNKAFEHWTDPEWFKFHVGWKEAIEDGRATLEFIEQQRKEITPLEFTVLYDSEFPVESEDSVFNLKFIEDSQKKESFIPKIEEAREIIRTFNRRPEHEVNVARDKLKDFEAIIAADIADKGRDETVILFGYKKRDEYELVETYSESKSENTHVAGKIAQWIKEKIGREIKGSVNLDCIGVGTGVVSMVKDFVRDNEYKNVQVNACHFGKKPINEERFRNKKAENFFRLKNIFSEGNIKIPTNQKLVSQLLSIKWKFTSGTEKIVIEDPEKSPDWVSALTYFIWKDHERMAFAFVSTSVFSRH